jgi:glycosyltransferase involved in cell wall biosynthesis
MSQPQRIGQRVQRGSLLLRSFISHARQNGMAAACVKGYQYLRWRTGRGYGGGYRRWFQRSGMGDPVTPAAALFATPSVLIVGPLDLPQCRKYRVVQKLELLRLLGVEGHMCHVEDAVRVYDLMQTATHLVLYRVRAGKGTQDYIDEARRLGLSVLYDVDDPIFDVETYRSNRNLEALSPREREHLLHSAEDHLAVMRQCDHHLVSTPGMAACLRRVLDVEATVWPNGVDAETRLLADDFRVEDPAVGDALTIAYMSGSRAHDLDFESVAPVLAEVLQANPGLRLLLGGYVAVPACLAAHSDRIDRVPFGNYHDYFQALSRSQIVLVPLLLDAFNECKSAIRYFEAALLELPVIASEVGQFRDVVVSGENGLLARDADGWRGALQSLVADAELRRRLGEAARATVLHEHTLPAIGDALAARLAQLGVMYPEDATAGAHNTSRVVSQ